MNKQTARRQFGRQDKCAGFGRFAYAHHPRTGRGLGCNGVITETVDQGNSWVSRKQVNDRHLSVSIWLTGWAGWREALLLIGKLCQLVKLHKFLFGSLPIISLLVDHQHNFPRQHQHAPRCEAWSGLFILIFWSWVLMTSRVGEHDNHSWRHLQGPTRATHRATRPTRPTHSATRDTHRAT